MRIKWAALLTSTSFLLGATSVSAQGPVALSSPQLDGIIPTYQLDPTQYQLRVAVDAVTVADPDRMRDALLMEVPEESMAAQQIPGDEPEARCTPARRALLASAGRSELAGMASDAATGLRAHIRGVEPAVAEHGHPPRGREPGVYHRRRCLARAGRRVRRQPQPARRDQECRLERATSGRKK